MVLRDAERADAAYTIVAFSARRERLRYLRGGTERETAVRETLERGGVYNERGHFFEVIR
jgi:hypothetical protein